jgi:hypothetical protein
MSEKVTVPSSLNLHVDYIITNTVAEAVADTQQEEHSNVVGMVEQHLKTDHVTEIQLVKSDHEDEMHRQHLSHSQSNPASLESDSQLVHSPCATPPSHTMVTRSQRGILKPNPKYALISSRTSATIPREPSNFRSALAHPGWKAAMDEELEALHRNQTWELVPCTPAMHVIGSKWVLKTKLKHDGSLDRLKARLVAKRYHQVDGLDYTETYSPFIKPGTIHIVLSIALVNKWSIRQLDVKNAFLHGFVSEDIYMEQPLGTVDHSTHHMCASSKRLFMVSNKHPVPGLIGSVSSFLNMGSFVVLQIYHFLSFTLTLIL